MNWATWLTSLVPGLVARVLASLGLGLATITGLSAVTTQLVGYLQSALGGMTADFLGFLNLCGMGLGLNIIVGALAARLAYYVLAKTALVVGVS